MVHHTYANQNGERGKAEGTGGTFLIFRVVRVERGSQVGLKLRLVEPEPFQQFELGCLGLKCSGTIGTVIVIPSLPSVVLVGVGSWYGLWRSG